MNVDYYDGGRLIRVSTIPSPPDSDPIEAPTVPCPACDGKGERGVSQDYFGNWNTEQCRLCDGEGEISQADADEFEEWTTK